jgi:hypothetical protein
MEFESSFMLFANKVILWNPLIPMATSLEDEITAKMFREIFLRLWKA